MKELAKIEEKMKRVKNFCWSSWKKDKKNKTRKEKRIEENKIIQIE